MKTVIRHIFKICMLYFLLFSCSNDDEKECISNNLTYVTAVDAPTHGIKNETILIAVSFPVSDGCGGFSQFIETANGNTKTIQVEARYKGCNCTQYAPTLNVNYEFTPENTGNYILNFKSSETEFIIVNLTIN